MKLFVKAAMQILKKNWLSLLIFELTYRIFAMVLLLKGADLAFKICLNELGYSYLTAENYGKFITYPFTILFIVLGLIVICFALTFEIHAIFSCFESSWREQKTNVPMMIRWGFKGTFRFIRKYPIRWLGVMLICSPYLCIHFIVWEVSQTKLLQFSIQQIGSSISHNWAVVALLILVFILSMIFSFALPRRIMTREKPKAIYTGYRGEMKTKSVWMKSLLYSASVQIFAALVVLLLYGIALLIMVAYVMLTRTSGTMVSAVLFYGRLIKYSAGVIVGGVGLTFTLLYLYTFFARSEKKEQYQQPKPRKKSLLVQVLSSRYVVISITAIIVLSETAYLLVAAQTNLPSVGAVQTVMAVTAHRGGARMAPENTMSAMKYAVEALADVAEIDVQETKDGEIVLLHDTNLKRTTGFNANIWDLTYDQVSQLDAGAKFNKKFRGEQVPTLEQVLKYCKGKIKLNIEVKYNGHNKGIVKKVVKIIEDNDFVNDCVVTSMNYKFLKQVKQENPDIKTGYTLRMTYGDLSELTYADFFSVKHTYISGQFVEEVHKLGKEVYAWTLNYQGDMQRMVNLNVDNIITDEPELVRKVILGETDRNPSLWTLLKYAIA